MTEEYMEQARETIERMLTIRPTCERCSVLSGAQAEGVVGSSYSPVVRQRMEEEGYEPRPHIGGFLKRCDDCRKSWKYPWAAQLHPDRVAAYIEAHPHAFLLDELRSTLHPVPVEVERADGKPVDGSVESFDEQLKTIYGPFLSELIDSSPSGAFAEVQHSLPVHLTQPYRTVQITGIAESEPKTRCPLVGCTKVDCDGEHKVEGPSSARGGFEFL
jgi:hypothetical protein